MNVATLRRQRLMSLGIARPDADATVETVVATLTALQAQDYPGALWAIGLRTATGTLADVDHAVRARAIVRTWPLRGTLHFVAADDVHWLLDLLAPRVIAASAKRHRDLELDAATFLKAERALGKALAGQKELTRDQVREALARVKIEATGERLYHCIWFLAQQKLLCCGAPRGKQMTYTLLSEWLPSPARPLESGLALARLAERYFRGHGPASQRDLMRWAGLTVAESKHAIAHAQGLTSVSFDGVEHWYAADAPQPSAASRGLQLLPGFDEYMLGYKDRTIILEPEFAARIVPGNNGMFRPTVVLDGQVIGTWKAVSKRAEVALTLSPFRALAPAQHAALTRAAERYGQFLGKTASWTLGSAA